MNMSEYTQFQPTPKLPDHITFIWTNKELSTSSIKQFTTALMLMFKCPVQFLAEISYTSNFERGPKWSDIVFAIPKQYVGSSIDYLRVTDKSSVIYPLQEAVRLGLKTTLPNWTEQYVVDELEIDIYESIR